MQSAWTMKIGTMFLNYFLVQSWTIPVSEHKFKITILVGRILLIFLQIKTSNKNNIYYKIN